MEPAVIVAIISAVVAMLTVIVSSIVNLATNKRAIRAEKELEEFKRQLDLRREGIEHRTKNIQVINEVLGKTCTHLQNIRDLVRRLKLTEEKENRLAILENLKAEYNAFVRLYSESHYVLPEFERQIFHDTRHYTFEIIYECELYAEAGNPLPSDIEAWLRPVQNAQRHLIAEYEKWNDFLLDGWSTFIFKQEHENIFQISSKKKGR